MLRRTKEGFSIGVPSLPGCWSQGATEAEALKNIEDAIREYLAVRTAGSRPDALAVCDIDEPGSGSPGGWVE
jgi:predicted RNase H-like HicB family nuclease